MDNENSVERIGKINQCYGSATERVSEAMAAGMAFMGEDIYGRLNVPPAPTCVLATERDIDVEVSQDGLNYRVGIYHLGGLDLREYVDEAAHKHLPKARSAFVLVKLRSSSGVVELPCQDDPSTIQGLPLSTAGADKLYEYLVFGELKEPPATEPSYTQDA